MHSTLYHGSLRPATTFDPHWTKVQYLPFSQLPKSCFANAIVAPSDDNLASCREQQHEDKDTGAEDEEPRQPVAPAARRPSGCSCWRPWPRSPFVATFGLAKFCTGPNGSSRDDLDPRRRIYDGVRFAWAGPTRSPHRVRVAGFWMDETDVTNAQFRNFVEATGYVTTAEKPVDWRRS